MNNGKGFCRRAILIINPDNRQICAVNCKTTCNIYRNIRKAVNKHATSFYFFSQI